MCISVTKGGSGTSLVSHTERQVGSGMRLWTQVCERVRAQTLDSHVGAAAITERVEMKEIQ